MKWRGAISYLKNLPYITRRTTPIDRIYKLALQAPGGGVFPTAAKIQPAEKRVKLLIINGAECEPLYYL